MTPVAVVSAREVGRKAVHSMTGYGRAAVRTHGGAVTVEMRSTNHRYLEIDLRLPNGLTALEGKFNELIRSTLRRGRVEMAVSVQVDQQGLRRLTLDEPLLEHYHQALVGLKGRFSLKGPVTLEHLLSLPQAVTIVERRLPSEQLLHPAEQAARSALKQLIQARRREGARLTADLKRLLQTIERHVQAVKRRLPKALADQRRELKRRLKELLRSSVNLSAAQWEQAAAMVREADIHEELVRLSSHTTHMQETLRSGLPVGKRLDFIAQELMRESNTMGAKVNDPEAVGHVVDIKSCIEKIREQVQNLE
ncbi:MAG: YicC family protein [Candidatus Omnitrophica bacterium]|nr:YicC family protein [Candidatus Omnitrophota bacterium]